MAFSPIRRHGKNVITQLATILHTNLHQHVPAPQQSLSLQRVIDLDLPRVLPSSLSKVDSAINNHPLSIMEKHKTSPEPEFALDQHSPNHHHMILRSQTEVSTNTPRSISPDNNTRQYFPSYNLPSHAPHVIPPDYTPSVNMATNFKKMAINQLIADHLFDSTTVHHVFNELTEKRETMDTLLQ